ncbi:MAG: hypothetical protein RBU37_26450, partial [Myxococcota bacterium]|nr:hypothetical protein [Myxococcota bacterium]
MGGWSRVAPAIANGHGTRIARRCQRAKTGCEPSPKGARQGRRALQLGGTGQAPNRQDLGRTGQSPNRLELG